MTPLLTTAFAENELENTAQKLLNAAGHERVFLFDAPMGAGKTTLIKAMCRLLGVQENMNSPTYSIINEYLSASGEKLYHMDLYRLNSTEECLNLGIDDYLFSGSYCFIEWPQLITSLITEGAIHVQLQITEGYRQLTASKTN